MTFMGRRRRAAALQDACGDHCDSDVYTGAGCSAPQIAAHLILGVDVVALTLRSERADLKVSAASTLWEIST
jgi:hypothetical protein